MTRFCKQTLLDYLNRRIEVLQSANNFDPNNGWAQVDGKGERINRDYAAWDILRSVLEDVVSGL